MNFSRPLRWFIALLLPLTFVWKLVPQSDDSVQLKDIVTRFLIDQKFEVTYTSQDLNEMPVIRATSASKACRMYVMRASPDGWNRDIIENYATVTDQIFVVFRGNIFHDQVSWKILVGYLRSEVLHRLGLASHENSVIAIVAHKDCDAERLPWDDLRDY